MSEITQTRVEDAVATTNHFLESQRGASLDGDFASTQIAELTRSMAEQAEDLLTTVPHPQARDFYVPLSKHNSQKYAEAVATLAGYLVLVPSSLVEPNTAAFYPAVVSEDGIKNQSLRLHVLKQPYRQQILYGASVVLSAAGQSETKGIGDHGRKTNDSVEAEHFATLLAAGSDQSVQSAWLAGNHVNHHWRSQGNSSVTSQVSNRLFGKEIPQETITITKRQIEDGKAMLLWHEGMRDEQGKPEVAAKPGALVVMQGLGFEALRQSRPQGVDDIKRILAVSS